MPLLPTNVRKLPDVGTCSYLLSVSQHVRERCTCVSVEDESKQIDSVSVFPGEENPAAAAAAAGADLSTDGKTEQLLCLCLNAADLVSSLMGQKACVEYKPVKLLEKKPKLLIRSWRQIRLCKATFIQPSERAFKQSLPMKNLRKCALQTLVFKTLAFAFL